MYSNPYSLYNTTAEFGCVPHNHWPPIAVHIINDAHAYANWSLVMLLLLLLAVASFLPLPSFRWWHSIVWQTPPTLEHHIANHRYRHNREIRNA